MRIRGRRNSGFSLTEVLLAVGVLSVGMIFVAGVFPVAIHFTTIATERTVAAVAADEAFAKIRLYGVNPGGLASNASTRFDSFASVDLNEYAYPSTNTNLALKQYFWSALCRRVGQSSDVQVTVLVCRRVGQTATYWDPVSGQPNASRPMPFQVGVSGVVGSNVVTITQAGEEAFINDGYVIVDDASGRLYRVLRRDHPATVTLDGPWQGLAPNLVWVVPPPEGGSRYPCVAVYQKVIRF